jgi:hypothetical protein
MTRPHIFDTKGLAIGLLTVFSACASSEPPAPRTSTAPAASSWRAEGSGLHRPYKESTTNFLYNLLFCDDLALFRAKDSTPPTGAWAILLSSTPRTDDVERIANDEKEESRTRMVAFNYLRSKKVAVPARQVLGVVVEVPLEGGLDTLAVFADGRMRYINHSEKLAIFEATPATMEDDRAKLMQAAAAAVAKIGPWDKPRRPPPPQGHVRLTFLVSDGLYFGEGPFSAILNDPIGGPVLATASDLLMKIVNATTK